MEHPLRLRNRIYGNDPKRSRRKRSGIGARLLLAALACCLVTKAVPGQETNRIQSLAQLRQDLASLVEQPRFDGALWGIKIISLDTGATLFESHANRLMSPASNSKLYTAALALDHFGSDYRISTPVFTTSKPNHSGTLRGDVVIVGSGDPSWNRARFGTNFWNIFEPFIGVLTNAGVRRIKGDIVADATFFRGPPTGSSWTVDDLQDYYGARISSLSLEDNYVEIQVQPGETTGAPCRIDPLQQESGLIVSNHTITVATNAPARLETYNPPGGNLVYISGQLPSGGSVQTLDIPVPQPADWFVAGLKQALARHGIKVSGKAHNLVWPQVSMFPNMGGASLLASRLAGVPASPHDSRVKLGEVDSPPLREIVRGFMKPSQNLEVDMLLEHVGEMTRGSGTHSDETSEDLGIAALHQFLSTAGLPSDEVHFDEGSGLSRNNLTTANATVALLQYMATNHSAEDFINSLPIAGVDGTLRRRMKGTPAAGNVRAKTGSLRWASALSGYVTSAAGERLAFSLMLNRYDPSRGSSSRADLDEIAEMLAGFSGHSTEASTSLEKTYAPMGKLILTQLASAPFPHPARANGHTYHGMFYSAKEHYSDSTVAIFIPKGFRETGQMDFVVHFHGWNHTVAGALPEYRLIEQFTDSAKNAILVVPQGPYNAPDSFGGKLEDTNGFARFMSDVVEKLKSDGDLARTNFSIGNIILSGHSGGYHVMAAILDHGGMSDHIKEVWLFDALYGGTDDFVAWQKAERGRLLDIYTDHGGTKEETENLMTSLKKNNVAFFASEDDQATPEILQTNKLVFLHTDMVHNDVLSKRSTFEQFLKTSCLESQ